MSSDFFTEVPGRIGYAGPDSPDPLSYAVYEPDRLVRGKRMADQLRIAVCLWHSFNWPGSDVFGIGTFDRPWLAAGLDARTASAAKLDAAFEFIDKLGVPFFTFHDRDVAPEGRTYAETRANLDASVDRIEKHMQRTGARLIDGRPVRHNQGRDPESTGGGHRGEHKRSFSTGEAGHQPGYRE